MRTAALAFALSLTLTHGAGAQPASLSNEEKASVIARMQEEIEPNYVFPEETAASNAALEKRLQAGDYAEIDDFRAFADQMTQDLVAIAQNKHFALVYNPGLIADWQRPQEPSTDASDAPDDSIDWNEWYATKDNQGFEKVEVLDGNVGYIKFDFFQPLRWARPTINAAMAFVANTDALIIDLTENGGGYSPTDAYLASHFLEPGTDLWSTSYNRPSDGSRTVELFDAINGARYLGKPVYVLVGANSFSMAEKLAYGLKHFGKAHLVGQVTSGAAHAIDIAILNDRFFLQIPVTYNIHPVTGTDWERKGVIPNTVSDVGDELRTAHRMALDKLQADAASARIKAYYAKIKAGMDLEQAASE